MRAAQASLVGRRRGLADEDAPAAGSVHGGGRSLDGGGDARSLDRSGGRSLDRGGGARGLPGRGGRLPGVGPLDLEGVEGHRLDVAAARRERPQRQAGRRHALGDHRPSRERDRHEPGPRPGREAHRETLVRRACARRPRRRVVGPAARAHQGDALAVHPDVQLLWLVAPSGSKLDAQHVVAVAGKVVPDGGAAPRPERQVLAHPPVLHQQRRHRIAHDVGLDRGVPDGETADRARRGHVPREQPRRDGQDGGVVVEAERHVVGRQQGLGVDLQVEQIAHRVGVLQPVEPMNRRAPRVGMVGRPPVERPLEPSAERVVDGRLRPRAPGRRHRPRVQLLQDLLPHLGVGAHLLQIGGVEGEVPGQRAPVVAGDAVAVEDGPVGRRRRLPGRGLPRNARCLGDRPGRSGEDGAGHQCPHEQHDRRRPAVAHHRRLLHHRLRRTRD